MSTRSTRFIVSALKHRPQTFGEVLAQDHVIRTLKHSLERKRIANAYIFSGSRGTGKTTSARIFAKALNCENLQNAEPCNKCESCTAVMRGVHPDVIEIDAASNTSVDNIRDLREDARFSPSQSQYKIYIIDESHMLSKSANNAFLKTLEEPPAHCKFIFATTELHKIPNTILSRCQRFQFRRIPVAVIVDHLKSILQNQDEIKLPDEDELSRVLFHISRRAEGVLRDALVLLDQALAFCSGGLNAAETEEILGVIEFDRIDAFVRAMFDNQAQEAFALIDQIADMGKDMRLFLSESLKHLRNLAVCKLAGADVDLLDLPIEFIKQVEDTADKTSLEQILYITDMLWDAERRMQFSSDARLILEMYALKASKVAQAVKINDLINQIGSAPVSLPQAAAPNPSADALTSAPAPKDKAPETPEPVESAAPADDDPPPAKNDPAPKAEAAPAAAPAPEPKRNEPTADLLRSTWNQFLHEVEQENPFLAGSLSDSVPIEITGQNLRIALPAQNAYHLKLLNQPRNGKAITQFLQKSFGKPLQAIYEVRQDMPTAESTSDDDAPGPETPALTRGELLEKVQQDPVMSKILEELPGRITDIKPEKA